MYVVLSRVFACVQSRSALYQANARRKLVLLSRSPSSFFDPSYVCRRIVFCAFHFDVEACTALPVYFLPRKSCFRGVCRSTPSLGFPLSSMFSTGFPPIQIKGLRKVYPTRGGVAKVAVKNTSLGIPRGECFGLLGINGAGKSSTLGMLSGNL